MGQRKLNTQLLCVPGSRYVFIHFFLVFILTMKFFPPKDNDEPEESVQQGRFVWPNFCLSPSVLTNAVFHTTNKNTWYHVYNRSRRSWQQVKVNHFLSVDTTMEILIKSVHVKICPQLEEYIMKAADPLHF